MATVLLLPVQDAAALPEGTTEYPPHVTLLYLGDMTEGEQLRAKIALKPIFFPPTVFALSPTYNVFGRVDDPEKSLVLRLTEPDASTLKALRDRAMKLLRDAGVQFPIPTFPEFLPHVTVDEGTTDEMYARAQEQPPINTVMLDAPVLSTEGKYTDLTAAAPMLAVEDFTYSEDQPRDDNGRFGSGGGGGGADKPAHEVESTKLTATAAKAFQKELTEQGHALNAPIRHVLGADGAWRGEQVAVSRDANGRITGAAAYHRDGKNEITLHDFRATEKGQGAGTAVLSSIAKEIADQKNPEMHVMGAVHTATSYYQKVGAEFKPEGRYNGETKSIKYDFGSRGTWNPEAVKALAAGEPIDRRETNVLPGPGEIWDGTRIVSDPALTAAADLLRYRVNFDYNEEQPRDDHGRFGSGGGGSSKEDSGKSLSVEDVRSWPKIPGPLGSQGGTWHRSPEGKEYLLKPTTTINRASNEIAAGAVYRAAGIPFPDTKMITDENGKPFILSEKIPDLEQRSGSWWNNHPEAQAKAAEGYGVDALLSHWDVLGLEKDNTLTTSDGTPVRIESGGAMGYRAMGGAKDSFAPGKSWGEPKSMRFGEQGQNLYGKMTDAQAADSLERAQNIDLGKVAAAWKDAGISTKDSAPWMKTLEERQAQIPGIVSRLRGSSDLALQYRTMVFEACHMPAGTPDGGQFVPCDTPGSVDSDGNPAGPDSAADIAQTAQKAAEASGSSKAEAKAIGDAAKAEAEAGGAGKPAGEQPEGEGKHPGAGKLEELSIKGLKGTPNYSTITHALYHLKHTEKGAAGKEQAQHIGDKSIYGYHGKKYDYMVVMPTGDPKMPNVYEFVPKGGTSMMLDHMTIDDALAQKDVVAAEPVKDPLDVAVAEKTPEDAFLSTLATTPDQVAALQEAQAAATSVADVATQLASIAPEGFNNAAAIYAQNPQTYEPGPKELAVAALLTQQTSNGEPDYMKIQDALEEGASPTLIDDLLDSVAINALSIKEAAGVLTGDYNPTQEQWEKIAGDQSDSAVQYIAGQVLGQINSAGFFDKAEESLNELHGDGIHGAEATMAMLDQMFEEAGKSFGGTDLAAAAVSEAIDISSQSFEPGGKVGEWAALTHGDPQGLTHEEAVNALTDMGYSPKFAEDLAVIGGQIGFDKMFEAIDSHNLQGFTGADLATMASYCAGSEINTFIDAAELKGGVSGDPASKLAGLKDVQAQNAPPGAQGGLTAGYYSALDLSGKYNALLAAGIGNTAANEIADMSESGKLSPHSVMEIVDAADLQALSSGVLEEVSQLPAGVINAIIEELGGSGAAWDAALQYQLNEGLLYNEAKTTALQSLYDGTSAPDYGGMTTQDAWDAFKEANNYNVGQKELQEFWQSQGFTDPNEQDGLIKASESIGMNKVMDIVENKSLEGLQMDDIVKLASSLSFTNYAGLDKALETNFMQAINPITALKEKFAEDNGDSNSIVSGTALEEIAANNDVDTWEKMSTEEQYGALIDAGVKSDVAVIISEASYFKAQPQNALAIIDAKGDLSKLTATEMHDIANAMHPNDLPYIMQYMGVGNSAYNDAFNDIATTQPSLGWQEQAVATADSLYSNFTPPQPPMPLSEKLDSITNPYDKLQAFKAEYPTLNGEVAAKIINELDKGGLTSQQVQDLITGAKTPGELPIKSLLSDMYGTEVGALSEFLGAKPGAYNDLANDMYNKDPLNPDYTKQNVLDMVVKLSQAQGTPTPLAASNPNADLQLKLQGAATSGDQQKAEELIKDNYAFTQGTSFPSIAAYAMNTSSSGVQALDVMNFLSGKLPLGQMPGVAEIVNSMSPNAIEQLAVGMGAEPHAFLSQWDPQGDESKAQIFENIVATEAPMSAAEDPAAQYAALPYDQKSDFALANGVQNNAQMDILDDIVGGTTDSFGKYVPGIDAEKAFNVVAGQTMGHLSQEDIASMAHSLTGAQILTLGTEVLGLPAGAVTGLGTEAAQKLGPISKENKDEQAEYVLNKMQAMAEGDIPGAMGAVPGTSNADVVQQYLQADNVQGKASILEATGLISNTGYQTTTNVLNATMSQAYGLDVAKVLTMLQNPDKAAALLTTNEKEAFANMQASIIEAVIPGFKDLQDAFPEVPAVEILDQMVKDQGGQITPEQLAKGVGADTLASKGIAQALVNQGPDALINAGVPSLLASQMDTIYKAGVSANSVVEALDTHSIAHWTADDISNVTGMLGQSGIGGMLEGITQGNITKQGFIDDVETLQTLSGMSQLEAIQAALLNVQEDYPPQGQTQSIPDANITKGLGNENMQQNAMTFAVFGGTQEGENYLQSMGISKNLAAGVSYLHGEGMDENALMKMLDDQSFAHFTAAETGVMIGALGNSGMSNLVQEVTGAKTDLFTDKVAEIADAHGTQPAYATLQMKIDAMTEINAQYQPKSTPYGVQPTNYAVSAAKIDSIDDPGLKADYIKGLNDAQSWDVADALVNAMSFGTSSEMVAQIATDGTLTGATADDINGLAQYTGMTALDEALTGYGMKFSDLAANAPEKPVGVPMSDIQWAKTWAMSQMAQQSVSPSSPQLADVQSKVAELQAADKTLSYKDAKDQAEALLIAPKDPPVGLNAAGGKIYGDPSVKVQASDLLGGGKVFNTSPVVGGIKPSLPNNAQIDNIIAKASLEFHSGTGISSYQYGNQVISLKQNPDGTFGARYYPNGVLDPKTGKIDVPQPKVATNAPGMTQADKAVLTGTQMQSYADYKAAKQKYDTSQKAAESAAKYPLPDIKGKGAGDMPVAAKHVGYTAVGAGTTPGFVADAHDANGKVSHGYYVYGKNDKVAVNRFEKLRDTIAHADAVKHGVGAPQGVQLPYNLPADSVTGYSQYQFKDGVFTLYNTTGGKYGISFEKGAKLEGAVEKIQAKAYSAAAGKVPAPAGGVFFGHEPQGLGKDFGADKQGSIAWGDGKYGANGGPKNYTATEFQALKAYGDSSYDQINSAMRGSYGYGSQQGLDKARLIDQAMRRTPTPEPITVYRGIKSHSSHARELAQAPVGALFRDKGFMSTSVSTGTAQTFAGGSGSGGYILKVDVPEGVPSSFKPGNQYPTEAELLLASNTTLEKTGDAYKDSNGFVVIPVRVVAVGAEPVDIATAIQGGGGTIPAMIGSLLLRMQAERVRRTLVAA